MERAEKVALISVSISAAIVVVKLIVAALTGSMAVLGELLDSLGDVLTSSITLVGLRLSRRPPDLDHPYGHAKFDSLLGLLSSFLLLEVEAYVVYRSSLALLSGAAPPRVSRDAVLLLASTSAVNAIRSLALWRTGGSEGLRIMQSEALNYGWDAVRTLIVAIVLLFSEKFPLIDSLAALVAAAAVMPSTLRVAYWSASDLLDRIDPGLLARIESILRSCREVIGVRRVRARRLGGILLVDAVVEVDPSLTAEEAGRMVSRLEEMIREEVGPSEVLIVPAASGKSREDLAREVAESVEGVRRAHSPEFYGGRGEERLHLHVVLDENVTLRRADRIAREVESRLKHSLGVREALVHVDHAVKSLPIEELRRRVEELKGVRWAYVRAVNSGEEIRLEVRVGADPEMRVREVNRLQHDVMSIAAELAPQARVSVRVVPACGKPDHL